MLCGGRSARPTRPSARKTRVERAALGDPGQLLEVAYVGDAARVGARVPPGRLVVADAHQERVEVQVPVSLSL